MTEQENREQFIDWNKAPADAEAGNAENKWIFACWYKRNQWGEVMVIVDGTDIDWLHMGGRKDFPFGAQLRPIAE